MNLALIKRFSANEVKEVAFQMNPISSLGPDGFPIGFYQTHGETVGKKVSGVVMDFLNSGGDIKQIHETYIVLIPKKKNARKFDDFRPISLCNVLYKIISKVLANRLKRVL